MTNNAETLKRLGGNKFKTSVWDDVIKLSYEELLELKARNLENIADIKVQLENSREKFATQNEKSDPAWYYSTKRAMAHKSALDNAIQMRLSQLNKDRKEAREIFPDFFIRAAEDHLPAQVFERIKQIANGRMTEHMDKLKSQIGEEH